MGSPKQPKPKSTPDDAAPEPVDRPAGGITAPPPRTSPDPFIRGLGNDPTPN